jgi:hypothetical protein
MKTRTDLLNHLVEKHGLKRYLEIGVQVSELNFDKIKCPYKVGVDPDPKALASLCMTSDQFFENPKLYLTDSEDDTLQPFDLIFIDGLHTAEQVKTDYENALKVLAPGGFIVLHDCNPEKEEHTIVPRPTKTGHWNGDVYRFACIIWYQVKITVDIDNGCCVVRPHVSPVRYFTNKMTVSWNQFDDSRKDKLQLMTWDEFIKL